MFTKASPGGNGVKLWTIKVVCFLTPTTWPKASIRNTSLVLHQVHGFANIFESLSSIVSIGGLPRNFAMQVGYLVDSRTAKITI